MDLRWLTAHICCDLYLQHE